MYSRFGKASAGTGSPPKNEYMHVEPFWLSSLARAKKEIMKKKKILPESLFLLGLDLFNIVYAISVI